MQKIIDSTSNRSEINSLRYIIKRDGTRVPFDSKKIKDAIIKASMSVEEEKISEGEVENLVKDVIETVLFRFKDSVSTVEDIQNIVEEMLILHSFPKISKSYILYRDSHNKIRNNEENLMKIYRDITFKSSKENDNKRENANIDSDTAMGTMLKYGSEGSKYFIDRYVLPKHIADAQINGDIHIHDKDFYMLTETCCQINLRELYKNGFSTGHGHITSPNSISSYAALACIVLQANQNEMHGGQAIPDFDYVMAEGVNKSLKKILKDEMKGLYLRLDESLMDKNDEELESYKDSDLRKIEEIKLSDFDEKLDSVKNIITERFKNIIEKENINIEREIKIINSKCISRIRKETKQAMQALLHNLNTMNSRAGAQVPFSSINYGTCTSEEGRLAIRSLLEATDDGLGDGETPIFPVQIFKVKEGINFSEGDKNYDLLRLAMRTSAKRLYPNFSFLDSSFNKIYYKEGKPETEVAYMGCRTRVMGNVFKDREETYGRGNLSFTSINLPRLAILSKGNIDEFYRLLDERLMTVSEQLIHRYKIQCNKRKYNYPFLMGQGIWVDSEKLDKNDRVEDVIKHGTLSFGFIGLAECLKALTGKHQGESTESQKLGLEIVKHMRDYADKLSQEFNLNFSLIATPAEGLSGRFVKMDRERYGNIEGVTDRDYYTNSFHVPVYCDISIKDKLNTEGQYHKFTNGGHISYVEVDGNIGHNIEAFYKILKIMKESDIGYGSINHPVDYDPVCNYTGVINDICPKCGRKEENHPFSRIRRITGYLVGTLDRFNDAKRSEVNDRVKHGQN